MLNNVHAYPAMPVTLLGIRYFQAGALIRRRRDIWHGVPGGCNIKVVKIEQRAYKIWEQEVYRDTEGIDWIRRTPALNKTHQAAPWYLVTPCATCHHKYMDDVLTDVSWQDRAACKGMYEQADWFNGDTRLSEVKAAIEICNRCPVMVECGEWAERLHLLDSPLKGTYGGETEKERTARLA